MNLEILHCARFAEMELESSKLQKGVRSSAGQRYIGSFREDEKRRIYKNCTELRIRHENRSKEVCRAESERGIRNR